MKIVQGFPPNYDAIKKALNPNVSAVFTYGDTIYCPYYQGTLPYHLIVHETTHQVQQGTNPEGWWKLYLVNPDFRLSQELAAYRAQYKHFAMGRDRNDAARFLYVLAHDLASAMYGNIITLDKAVDLIMK